MRELNFDGPKPRGLFGDAELPKTGQVHGRAKLVDCILLLRQERATSLMVSEVEGKASWISLPKSEIEFTKKAGGLVDVTMPEWLAQQKGLI